MQDGVRDAFAGSEDEVIELLVVDAGVAAEVTDGVADLAGGRVEELDRWRPYLEGMARSWGTRTQKGLGVLVTVVEDMGAGGGGEMGVGPLGVVEHVWVGDATVVEAKAP